MNDLKVETANAITNLRSAVKAIEADLEDLKRSISRAHDIATEAAVKATTAQPSGATEILKGALGVLCPEMYRAYFTADGVFVVRPCKFYAYTEKLTSNDKDTRLKILFETAASYSDQLHLEYVAVEDIIRSGYWSVSPAETGAIRPIVQIYKSWMELEHCPVGTFFPTVDLAKKFVSILNERLKNKNESGITLPTPAEN